MKKDILVKDILTITLEEAYKTYQELNIGFIVRDGKLKGFTKEQQIFRRS